MRYAAKYLLLNVLCRLIPHPKLRARYLALLGAVIGREVRIEDVRFIQIQFPIAHLQCADRAFIGAGVTIDLSAPIALGENAIVGPGCSLITHQDFGHFNGNTTAQVFPLKYAAIQIGANAVVGCDTTVLAGATIDPLAVIGAKSLVSGHVPGGSLFFGAPAQFVRSLAR